MNRILYASDCLKVLNDRDAPPDESVDLIYLDPPFNSNSHYNTSCPQLALTEGEDRHAMEAPVEFYKQEGWYIGHCPSLEIKSQGDTEEEAKENLLEALSLFFEYASYSEIMSFLSQVQPSSQPEAWFKPISSLDTESTDKKEIKGEISLAYA